MWNRRSTPLAVHLRLSLFVASFGLPIPLEAAEAPCQPSVSLQGTEPVVVRLQEALKARGLNAMPTAGCPAVLARVEEVDKGVAVTIVEIVNQDVRREFATPEQASAFIESWSRRDVSAPLLSGPRTEPAPKGAPLRQAPWRMSFSVGAEVGVGSGRFVQPAIANYMGGPLAPQMYPRADQLALVNPTQVGSYSSSFAGARLTGCGRLGPVCLGGLLSFRQSFSPSEFLVPANILIINAPPQAPQPEQLRFGDRFSATITGTLDISALVTVDYPLVLSRYLVLVPSLGLGGGFSRQWLRNSSMITPYMPKETIAPQIPDSVDQGLFKLRASLSFVVPIAKGLAAELGVVAEFSSATMTQLPRNGLEAQMDIASPPWGLLSGQVGFRWSAPK